MDQKHDESMDRLTESVARAGGIGDEAAEHIASSPFFHARLRAGIEAERRRQVEQGSGRLTTLLVASRAIAAMAVVTVGAVVTLWVSKSNASVNAPPENESDIARVVTAGACALSATDECAISNDEVLATLFAENRGEERK